MLNIFSSFLWRRKMALIIVTVITANVYATHGQSFLLDIGESSHGYFERELVRYPFVNDTLTPNAKQHFISSDYLEVDDNNDDNDDDDKNSTLIVIKSSLHSSPTELSQAAMDVITIVWYVATFLALAAFFMLMACSDRRCNARQRAAAARRNETPNPPPTPSPSYSEFAPPSYESVMKMQNSSSVYVIPFPLDDEKDEGNNSTTEQQSATSPPPPLVTFYTVDELQKLGS